MVSNSTTISKTNNQYSPQTIKHKKKDHDIPGMTSRSWVGIGTKM